MESFGWGRNAGRCHFSFVESLLHPVGRYKQVPNVSLSNSLPPGDSLKTWPIQQGHRPEPLSGCYSQAAGLLQTSLKSLKDP